MLSNPGLFVVMTFSEDRTGGRIAWWGGLLLVAGLHLLPGLWPTVGTWFYPIIWWSFIGLLEWSHSYRGQTVFVGSSVSLLRVASFSTVLWFVFEVYNLYLGNWYYVGVPDSRALRWLGTTVSFATVLPGMWVVQRGVEQWSPDSWSRQPGLPIPGQLRTGMMVFGLICSIGPFLFPDRLFPFVWGGLLFVADGLASRFGGRSFMDQIEEGNYRPFFTWLIAGGICGFLWEFWNVLASAGWIYTVPGMGDWRLFEMPLLGYLGFPPFALMAWRLYTLWTDLDISFSMSGKILTSAASVLFCVMTLVAMDHYTYASTVVHPSQFVGWTEGERRRLQQYDDSLPAARHALYSATARRKIELLSYAGLGTEIANCLWKHRVRSVADLKREQTDRLARWLKNCHGGPLRFWNRRVKDWKQRD